MAHWLELDRAFPDQVVEIIALHNADDAVLMEAVARGTHPAPPRAAADRPQLRAAVPGDLRLRGRGLVCERVYFDTTTVLRAARRRPRARSASAAGSGRSSSHPLDDRPRPGPPRDREVAAMAPERPAQAQARGARPRAHGLREPARVRRHPGHLPPPALRADRHRRGLRRRRGGRAILRGEPHAPSRTSATSCSRSTTPTTPCWSRRSSAAPTRARCAACRRPGASSSCRSSRSSCSRATSSICERVYFDSATMLRQLGVARDPLSLTGRLQTVVGHPLTIGRGLVRQLTGR